MAKTMKMEEVKEAFARLCREEYETLKQGPRHHEYTNAALVWKGFKAGLEAAGKYEAIE